MFSFELIPIRINWVYHITNLENKMCPWCSITEADEDEAAMGNPLRMLDAIGGLGDYLAGVAAIERKRK